MTKKKFGEVYAFNTLPFSHLSNIVDKYFMVNYDPDTHEGSHWVVLHIDWKNGNEYFDSYGQPPLLKVFEKFLREKSLAQSKRIQHPMSIVCGQYCLFFIYMRCKGWCMKKILSLFTSKEEHSLINDVMINSAVEKLFATDQDVIAKRFMRWQISKTQEKKAREG